MQQGGGERGCITRCVMNNVSSMRLESQQGLFALHMDMIRLGCPRPAYQSKVAHSSIK